MSRLSRICLILCLAGLAGSASATCMGGWLTVEPDRERCLTPAVDGGVAVAKCKGEQPLWEATREGVFLGARCLVLDKRRGKAPAVELGACGSDAGVVLRDGQLSSGGLCLAVDRTGSLAVEACGRSRAPRWSFSACCVSP